MTLQIKQFPKAQVLYAAIIELDNEITVLDKKSIRMANNTESVLLNLAFNAESISEPAQEQQAELFNMGGGIFGVRMHFPDSNFSSNPNLKKDNLNFNLTEIETLYVLDALIQCKKVKRRELIQDFKNLGYEL